MSQTRIFHPPPAPFEICAEPWAPDSAGFSLAWCPYESTWGLVASGLTNYWRWVRPVVSVPVADLRPLVDGLQDKMSAGTHARLTELCDTGEGR